MPTAILFSGGFDSGAVALLQRSGEYADLLFIDYQQTYREKELEAAKKFAALYGMNLVVEYCFGRDDMADRNKYFMVLAKYRGYDKVIMGVRNPTPIGDKHGDSNYFTLSRYAKAIGMQVEFPILWWTKKKVFNYLMNCGYFAFYNCYNNQEDFEKCDCSNCKQRVKYIQSQHRRIKV